MFGLAPRSPWSSCSLSPSLSPSLFCEAQEIKQTPQLFAPIERFLRFASSMTCFWVFVRLVGSERNFSLVKTKDMIGFVGQGQKVVVVLVVYAPIFLQVRSFPVESYTKGRTGLGKA